MGIGAAMVGLGTWITAGVATGITAGAIGGAIIGAAIGGLTAAVTGGSIGKGMLFGAVGGAVTGGISGYLGAGVSAGTAGGAGATGWGGASISSTVTTPSVLTAGNSLGGQAVATSATSASTALESIGGEVVAKGVVAGIEGYMGNEAQKDAQKFADEQSALAHERNKETMRLASELANSSSSSGGSGTDNTAAHLAYKARMAELGQRKSEFDQTMGQTRTEWDTEMERRAQRRGLFTPDPTGSTVGDGAPDPTAGGQSIIEKRQQNVQMGGPATPNVATETALTPENVQ